MFFHRLLPAIVPAAALVFLTGCAGKKYVYEYHRGYTATLVDGRAVAPSRAPETVRRAIDAGNAITGMPYRRGGGHRRWNDTAFDCSGAVSRVLHGAGLLETAEPSRAFRRYGKSGEGKWITVYARKGHVFLVVAGLRFDTGWGDDAEGPRWHTRSRPARGYKLRHPPGL